MAAVLPHVPAPSNATRAITFVHVLFAVGFWYMIPESTFPGPISIARSFRDLWFENALGRELLTSLSLNLRMIAILIPIGILAVVMRSLALTKGVVTIIGNFRFLGMSGLTLLFTFYTSGALSLRLSLLVFFVGAYYVTSLARIVDSVPQADRDYVRTLGMSEWQAMYEVDLRGNAIAMWDALRQNQAMGWMMLTGVEGLTKSAGGVGTLLLNSQRTWNLSEVYAIQITLWVVGLLIDQAFVHSQSMFPWFRAGERGDK